MPVIVDASIQGKLDHPIMSNVLTDNDKMEFSKGTARLIETTGNNTAKINREKGVPAIPAQVKTQSAGSSQGRAMAQQNSVSISEQFTGQNVNAVA